LEISKDDFRRIILVTVTLEPLDTYNASLAHVAKAGILKEGELPWAVSLDVLRVIAEINEFPSQLIHYLTRRLQINLDADIETQDELDWFGYYLSKGLYFKGMKSLKGDAAFVHIMSHTAPFDDYYFFEMGMRTKPVAKPVQPMPELMRKIILELESRHDSPGFSEAVMQLLDWGDETRKKFVQLFNRIRKMTRRDSGTHDFTLVSTEDGAGITCFSSTPQGAEEAFSRLARYVEAKKYQQKCDMWLGLLTVVGENGLVHGFISGAFPWTYDEILERHIKEFFSNSSIR
jgi:hypothetical protein